MSSINPKDRERMSQNPWYSRCAFATLNPHMKRKGKERLEYRNEKVGCDGHIQWHHNLIFKSNKVQREFAIIPLCVHHHAKIDYIRHVIDFIMMCRMTEGDFADYHISIDANEIKFNRYLEVYGENYLKYHPEAKTHKQKTLEEIREEM
jgi:hypothetical protein